MIRAVLFDLDNTLVDFMKLKKASCEEAIDAMIDAGLAMPKQKALEVLFDLYDKHGIEYKQIFQEFLKKTIGHVDWKLLSAGVVAYRRVKVGYMSPYPGVQSLLIELKRQGLLLGIVTDAPRMRAWLRLAALKIADFFDVVVAYEDTRRRKPSRKPFMVAIAKIGVVPEEVLMVGDWPERDINGAKRLGMRTCYAKYGAVGSSRHSDNHGADFMIDSPIALLKILDLFNTQSVKK